MVFDPDAFLTEEFDPDMFLASQSATSSIADQIGLVEQPMAEEQNQPEGISKAGQAILDMPGGPAVSEFMSAVNRGAVNLLDYFTTDQINNVLQVIGSEKRVPSIGEQPIVQEATIGEFMDPGLPREAVRTAGEFVAPVAASGQLMRTAAGQIPKIANLTTGQRVVQSVAAKPLPEAIAGAVSGAGSEVGADVGEMAGGEKGAEIGRLAGGIIAPIGVAMTKETVKSLLTKSTRALLSEAAPTVKGLKEAAKQVYREIDDLGVKIKPDSVTKLSNQLAKTMREKGFDADIHPKVNAALKRFDAVKGQPQSTSELDILRRVASSAAKSTEPDEKRLGTLMINKIDDFLDNAGKSLTTQKKELFTESNRLSNINKKGGMWQAIKNENPAIKETGEVTVYRATIGNSIKDGDFVAANKTIAEQHMKNLIDRGEGVAAKMLTKRVNIKDLKMANDATEFILSPPIKSASSKAIGAKYKDARQLWRRVRKTEQIELAVNNAKLSASGFENGIRNEFRSILKNPKRSKGFTQGELKAMREVVEGKTLQNIAKKLGKFGFGEGQASNMLMGYAGIAGGAAVGGPIGAVVVPSVGSLSRKLAQKITRKGAEATQMLIRAGKNGADVTKAYMRIVKPKDRDARELAELLLRPEISLKKLQSITVPQASKKLINDAVFLVNTIKAAQKEEE